jgi:hypothetical protein
MHHSLTLLTVNGRCSKPMQLHPIQSVQLIAEHKIRRVRNFVALKLRDLGIDIMVYARGGFKVTIKNTVYVKDIVFRFELFLEKIVDILEIFYRCPIARVTVKVSQLATVLRYPFVTPEGFVLTYQHLLAGRELRQNKLQYLCQTHLFVHTVNWVGLEEGVSSFYFKIRDSAGVNLGDFKVYNNLKIILFTYNINQLPMLPILVTDFVQNVLLTTL